VSHHEAAYAFLMLGLAAQRLSVVLQAVGVELAMLGVKDD
jgi:hypothetical protein